MTFSPTLTHAHVANGRVVRIAQPDGFMANAPWHAVPCVVIPRALSDDVRHALSDATEAEWRACRDGMYSDEEKADLTARAVYKALVNMAGANATAELPTTLRNAS